MGDHWLLLVGGPVVGTASPPRRPGPDESRCRGRASPVRVAGGCRRDLGVPAARWRSDVAVIRITVISRVDARAARGYLRLLRRHGRPARRSVPRAAAPTTGVRAGLVQYVRFGEAMPTWMCQTHLYPLDGAAARVGATETAWAWRNARFAQMFIGAGQAEHRSGVRDWATSFAEDLRPYGTGGVYPNFLMDEGPERARSAYRSSARSVNSRECASSSARWRPSEPPAATPSRNVSRSSSWIRSAATPTRSRLCDNHGAERSAPAARRISQSAVRRDARAARSTTSGQNCRRRAPEHADPDGPAARPGPSARKAEQEAPAASLRTPRAALRTAAHAGLPAPARNVPEPPAIHGTEQESRGPNRPLACARPMRRSRT